MQLLQDRWNCERGWRGALILIAIFSLTFNLATRFCVQTTAHIHIVKSVERRAAEPKRQHLNKDATRWLAPTPEFTRLEPATFHPHLALPDPILANHISDESLYNRPPPSGAFSL